MENNLENKNRKQCGICSYQADAESFKQSWVDFPKQELPDRCPNCGATWIIKPVVVQEHLEHILKYIYPNYSNKRTKKVRIFKHKMFLDCVFMFRHYKKKVKNFKN